MIDSETKIMHMHADIKNEKSCIPPVSKVRKCIGDYCKRKRSNVRSIKQFDGDSQLCKICAKRASVKNGFFVDWNGNIREIENPGDGYYCEIHDGFVHVMEKSDGEVIFDADYHPNLEELKKLLGIVHK